MEKTSPPMRGRGLKQRERGELQPATEVAPHAGAWIETSTSVKPKSFVESPPHAGAWIETPPESSPGRKRRRPPCGGVD